MKLGLLFLLSSWTLLYESYFTRFQQKVTQIQNESGYENTIQKIQEAFINFISSTIATSKSNQVLHLSSWIE